MSGAERRFDLTNEHLILLCNAWVEWGGDEGGAPAINPKRPYGNSNVAQDVHDLLGWPYDREAGLTDAERERALKLHRSTVTALQIVLSQLPQVATPGRYICTSYGNDWWPVVPQTADEAHSETIARSYRELIRQHPERSTADILTLLAALYEPKP